MNAASKIPWPGEGNRVKSSDGMQCDQSHEVGTRVDLGAGGQKEGRACTGEFTTLCARAMDTDRSFPDPPAMPGQRAPPTPEVWLADTAMLLPSRAQKSHSCKPSPAMLKCSLTHWAPMSSPLSILLFIGSGT